MATDHIPVGFLARASSGSDDSGVLLGMRLHPIHDRLVVKRIEPPKQVGLILMAESVSEKPDQGKVIAAGAGKIREDGSIQPMEIKVGDHVLFGKYSGQSVNVDGEDVLVMREDDVMAVRRV